ncbi:MAG: OmpA family protein [Phycisphaerales bacterium]|nr:OmpA family protein [Phycisphaerales bacterium]
MKSGRWIVVVLAGAMSLAAGCVSMDEYRKVQMDNNKLIGEKTNLEQELYDSRNNNDSLRTKLTAAEDQLRSREMLASNLQNENDRLAGAVSRADSLLQDIARKNVPTDPIVIETVLPAALDTAIKDFAQKYPDSVYYDAKRGVVKWKSDLLFALGSDVVKQTAVDSLRGFADIIKSPAAAGFDVLVVGHTDDTRIGKPQTREQHPTNWHLSAHRAISVAKTLREDGLSPEKIAIMGFGEYRPIASNASDTGRSQNRRVEIYVVPEGSVGGVVAPQMDVAAREQVIEMPLASNEGTVK